MEVRLTGWDMVPRVNAHDGGDEDDGVSVSMWCWYSVKTASVSALFSGRAAGCTVEQVASSQIEEERTPNRYLSNEPQCRR